MLFSQGNGAAAGGMNAMLPLMLAKKSGKEIDPMMLMMMSGGLGGGAGGMNPMMLMALAGGDLFGSKASAAPTPLGCSAATGVPPLTRI
jgi:hypothetical protein